MKEYKKIDSDTLEIKRTQSVSKERLLRNRQVLEDEIEAFTQKIVEIDKQLDVLKEVS